MLTKGFKLEGAWHSSSEFFRFCFSLFKPYRQFHLHFYFLLFLKFCVYSLSLIISLFSSSLFPWRRFCSELYPYPTSTLTPKYTLVLVSLKLTISEPLRKEGSCNLRLSPYYPPRWHHSMTLNAAYQFSTLACYTGNTFCINWGS